MVKYLTFVAALASMAHMAVAREACLLKKIDSFYDGRAPYCNGQGEGDYTFTLVSSNTDVPTFNSGAPFAGDVGSNVFVIYDNGCNVKGAYVISSNTCGTPYVIKDDYLDYDLVITGVNFDSAKPGYAFSYNYKTYATGHNHCVCHDTSSGLSARKACPCAFPVHG